MKRFILAVRDRAADTFLKPMFVEARGLGIRAFEDEVNRQDQDNPLYRHPEDFDLYELGEYDDSSGKFVSLADGPRQIAVGKDFVKPTGTN